jgi:hypothetical protein|uniref:Uncharacterized protein n=1 Tax=viral metagenome TaxID=1070528 RepID=A0A6C0KVL6_9ZZZZ
MVLNIELRNRIEIITDEYDKLYPPIGELKKIPSGDETEMYVTALFIYDNINIQRRYVIHPYRLKLFCSEKLRYIKYKNISLLIDKLVVRDF